MCMKIVYKCKKCLVCNSVRDSHLSEILSLSLILSWRPAAVDRTASMQLQVLQVLELNQPLSSMSFHPLQQFLLVRGGVDRPSGHLRFVSSVKPSSNEPVRMAGRIHLGDVAKPSESAMLNEVTSLRLAVTSLQDSRSSGSAGSSDGEFLRHFVSDLDQAG